MVSSIAFHPTNPYLCALSLIYNIDFDKWTHIQGKSALNSSSILILNFQDSAIITLFKVLESPIEIAKICFHPDKPEILFGGAVTG